MEQKSMITNTAAIYMGGLMKVSLHMIGHY